MKNLLVLLCCLEVLLATYLVNIAGPFVAPVLFLGTSLAICFLYLKIADQETVEAGGGFWKMSPGAVKIAQWVVFLACSYFLFTRLKYLWWYDQQYGDPRNTSDIIPQITVLLQRFMAGEQPYSKIYFTGYDMFPTYMPLQWMPYIFCEWAKKDYRWIPTFGMWVVSLYYFLRARRATTDSLLGILIPVWPLLVWAVFVLHDSRIFVYTVEGLIAAYYLFVAESITLKRMLPLAIGIAVCLLSRYSIVFWVPLCVLLLYFSGRRKDAIIVCAVFALLFVAFYLLPFLSRDATIFLKGYAYHTNAAYYEWLRDMEVYGGNRYLYNGLGFTSWGVSFIPGNLLHKLSVYKNIHLAMCMLTVVGLGWFYVKRQTRHSLNTYLLFSFKVYLTIFYAFIQIPYTYLYFVPVMVTASLLAASFRAKPVNDN
jgi:hypothetical protein